MIQGISLKVCKKVSAQGNRYVVKDVRAPALLALRSPVRSGMLGGVSQF